MGSFSRVGPRLEGGTVSSGVDARARILWVASDRPTSARHFAHHPFDAMFGTNEVKQRCASLSMFNAAKDEVRHTKDGDSHRAAYLVSCGRLCAELLAKSRMGGAKATRAK